MTTVHLDELRALAEIAKARSGNLQTLLKGTHLEWGKFARERSGMALLKHSKKIKSHTTKLVQGGAGQEALLSQGNPLETGKEFIRVCSGIQDYQDVVDAVTNQTLQQLFTEMTPFLGILTSGLKSAKGWKQVFEGGRNIYQSNQAKLGVLPGDPRAAVDAIITLLERKLAKDSVNAARHSATLGVKVAGLFADLGTATTAGVGLANAVAGLALELANLGLDYHDLKAGNKRLAQPEKLNATIFDKCPILGCYIIVISDTSNVLNFCVADIGLPGWMDHVEAMKRQHLDKLIKTANSFIVSSRIHLAGLHTTKGIKHKKTMFAKAKHQFDKYIASKL